MEGLVAQGLMKWFKTRKVVDSVSLDIQRGEIVGLLGPNGAGKTTSFYMMVGLLTADGGRIFLEGQEITKLPMYQRCRMGVGYLPQESSVFRKLTVEENLLAILETLELTRDERRDRARELLAELDLTPLARYPAYTLSGGERRRLEITRALVTSPQYLLLDEQGPDHSRCFKIAAQIGRHTHAGAWGSTKKEAEQRAAMNALAQINGDPIPFESD
jgi:lipopolysaccharide export system ATP-binding protein